MPETIRATKKPVISWIGSGSGRHANALRRKSLTKATRLDERNVRQQNVTNMTERVTVAGPTDVNQLEILLPHLKLDMSLVLVLVQDCSLDLNLAVGSSQNRLAPSTPKSK